MFVNRTHGVVATTLGVLALGACASPEQNTDLRPEGPPDVLAVLVMTDAASQLSEHATFCKPNDEKAPRLVGLPDASTSQICPDDGSGVTDDVTDAYPDGWYVRVMFDELLDPSVEELVDIDGETQAGTLVNTQPVRLQCQNVAGQLVDVSYDGYYSPAGNNVTWPLGPSLVIKPDEPRQIATGATCQITLKDTFTDKQGNPVDSAQRGPYKFKIAEITPLATDPTDSGDTAEPTEVDALAPYFDNFYFQFNTDVQLSSFCDLDALANFYCQKDTENFTLTPPVVSADAGGGWDVCSDLSGNCDVDADCGAGVTCMKSYAYTYNGLEAGPEIGIGYNTPLKTETTYTFALKEGAKLVDRCGAETTVPAPSADNLYSITFKTNKFDFASVSIASGETAGPSKKPNIKFNNVVDAASLAPTTEFTITPTPNGAAIGQLSGGEIIVGGNFALDTQYTLTIKAGATVLDAYGATWTNDADKVITWKTAPAIIISSATADNTEIQKVLDVQPVGPTITWNSNMDLTSLATTEWSLVDAATGAAPTGGAAITAGYGSSASGANCTATSQSCQFRFRGDLPEGDYIFTLKAGATITDKIGNTYTQAADRVIHFTVHEPVPAVQCL